jgi:hypothetical protein
LRTASEAIQQEYVRQQQWWEAYEKEFTALMPDPDSDPIIYWSCAGGTPFPGDGSPGMDSFHPGTHIAQFVPAKGGYLLNPKGRWLQVKRSGNVVGFGHHEIKDETGKLILILDVTPLTTATNTR